ncbi:hypothetical protein HDU79_002734 [Rhizoclosmatium sp. JEL0117]|nr:hypothetical protein HDU79_002734 [Rhizoclosmatium sp. JEL0117]
MRASLLLFAATLTTTFAKPNSASNESQSREYLERLYGQAKAAYSNRDFETAHKHFSRLHDLLPDWKDNYFNWALSQIFGKRIDRFFDIMDMAVKQYPNDSDVYLKYCNNIASMLNQPNDFLNLDSYRTVKEMVDTCIKATLLDPTSSLAYATTAAMLNLVREYKHSIDVYEDWFKRFGSTVSRKEYFSTLTSFSQVLVQDGQFDRAYKIAEEIVAEDPTVDNVGQLCYVRKIGYPLDKKGWKFCNETLYRSVAEYSLKGSNDLCGTGKWRVALNYSEEAATHPELLTTTLLNPSTAYETYGSLSDPTFVGPVIPKYPRLFHERFVYLIHHPSAYLTGHPGIVHGHCTLYTGGKHANVDIRSFQSSSETHIITIPHRTAHIIVHQIRNYYHWLVESLPKLLLLQTHLLSLPNNEDIKILLPEKGIARWIDATLALPEFDAVRDRFIYYDHPTTARYYFPKGLYEVDWIHPAVDVHRSLDKNAWGVFWPPRMVLETTREFWHGALKRRGMFPTVERMRGSIVYVSREGTVRGFPNEGMLEQARVFAGAKVVVGSHGAGLVNYVYTQPGAVLVMVPMDPHVEFCFGHLVAAFGGRHYVVTEVPGAHYFGTYAALTREQMEVMGDTIERAWRDVFEDGNEITSHDEL